MPYINELLTLLKIAGACGITGFSMRILIALHNTGKLQKLKGYFMTAKIKDIDFGEGHSCVFGKTGSGKTYGTEKTLNNTKKAVFFFNPLDVPLSNGFVKATYEHSFDNMDSVLDRGRKINYVPHSDLEVAKAELRYLINKLFDRKIRDFYFVIDEVHLFCDDRETLQQVKRVPATGRRFGIKGIFISQRGTEVNKVLVTQSDLHVFFATNMEENYWRQQYGIPLDEIQQKIESAGEFSYCTNRHGKIEGAFKVR